MKVVFTVIFSLLLFFTGNSQTVTSLLKQADSLEISLDEMGAYNKFRDVLKNDPRNYYSLWKCSELCSRIGNRQTDKQAKIDYFKAAKIYAETAIKVNPAGADGYYALSVAMGRSALISTGSQRIVAVREIKTNAEKAIKINAQHGRAWHVLGKWHYEVSDLNAIEKAGLKIMYGGLPKASLKESITAYENARSHEPLFALNTLELARAYHRDGQDAKAIILLKELPSIPPRTQDDPRVQAEGRKLLAKCKR